MGDGNNKMVKLTETEISISPSDMAKVVDLASGAYIGSVARWLSCERANIVELPREDWDEGQAVVCRLSREARFELSTGREIELTGGDLIIGAFGTRKATLEVAGSWRDGDRSSINLLSASGVIGACTSYSPFVAYPVELSYIGHLVEKDSPLNVRNFGIDVDPRDISVPVVLVIGTSMSSGKTMACRAMIRELRKRGTQVGACKLAGVARWRDTLSMSDAGAVAAYDFVEAGLVSTVTDEGAVTHAARIVLTALEDAGSQLIVCELGASPLEDYQGAAVMKELEGKVQAIVMAASDPYAVLGLQKAYGLQPDVVTGRATVTEPGRRLVEKLVDTETVALDDKEAGAILLKILDLDVK